MQDLNHQQYSSKPYQAPGAAAGPKGHRGSAAELVGCPRASCGLGLRASRFRLEVLGLPGVLARFFGGLRLALGCLGVAAEASGFVRDFGRSKVKRWNVGGP